MFDKVVGQAGMGEAAAITEKCEEERDICDTGQGGGEDGAGEGG